MPRHFAWIELHPHGHEEQTKQGVLKWPNVLLDLVTVLGLRDQHAGKEGTQRERQARSSRHPRESQSEQQQIEHEQLRGLLASNQMKPWAHQTLPDEEHKNQHNRSLQCCIRE